MAAAIRFNTPAPVTLTLASHLNLVGEGNGNPYYGAILVTPNVGAHTNLITGSARLCQFGYNGFLTVHQYNTAAPLVIAVEISPESGAGTGLVKTGPGELVLAADNRFGRLDVFEGTLTFGTVAAMGNPSPLGTLGALSRISLTDATLRYTGPAQSTNLRIQLRGFGVIEASGTGALTLTDNNPVFPNGSFGGNQLLTLSGSGAGVIAGSLNNLNGGRLWKKGPGTWTLNGNSANILYGAEIFEGTIILNGTLGRDVTVGNSPLPTPNSPLSPKLTGPGTVKRDLYVNANGTIAADPAAPLKVGKNLIIASGAILDLPRKLPPTWEPVILVGGKIEGEFDKPAHAYVKYEGNAVLAKHRPVGTLLLVK